MPFPHSQSILNLQFFQHNTNANQSPFDGSIDWNDPGLYQSLPSLSELLNEYPDMQDVLLPAIPQSNVSDLSGQTNTSGQTSVPQSNVSDVSHAIDTSEQTQDEVATWNDRAGQIDNNQERLLESHMETGTSEIPADANNSSWAARNPNQPVFMSQASLNTVQKAQANVWRASRKISAAQCKENENALTSSIQRLLREQNDKIDAITSKHGITQEKVKKLMEGEKYYKGSQNMQLSNALIHAKAQEVNADHPHGAKYSLDEIWEMVKADKSMQNLDRNEQQEYINKLKECHALQNMSVCAMNTAAARDVQSMLDNVFKMAMWFGTDNIMDFWEDVLQMEADEITWKLEQWACIAGRNLNEWTLAKRHDIHINYMNFDIAMKEKLGIDLKGWPEGLPFQSSTSINNLDAILKLHDTLKDGSCHWFHMSPCQWEEYSTQLTVQEAC
ncbi:uncharacterized protein BJ212DRAFT_1298919 [Suillus subaureus]|uniref:Uncharacterized protein n=1 Tax=Suillus subaureus TaxID=48587 RepID=A0A9P7ED94_9AGAM|nr:uncharacterized protein BJ212DRAFT_1298919 [Suillus subaureus]KAG1818069.1 hypothetical protein BJ212DRAFT_1298919 [Suillus subaureus]